MGLLSVNAHKGTNLATFDPDTNEVVRLFHPRRDQWADVGRVDEIAAAWRAAAEVVLGQPLDTVAGASVIAPKLIEVVLGPPVELLVDLGLDEACKKQPALIGGINTRDGKLTCRAVAEAHGLNYEAPL